MRYLLLLCLCGWSFSQVNAQQRVAPPEWQPSLIPVRQELESQIRRAWSQQTINRLTARLLEVADAELFLVYTQLYERSSSSQRAVLLREQQRWYQSRLLYAVDHTYVGGVSTDAEMSDRDVIRFIDARAEALRKRLPHKVAPGA